MAEHSTVVTSAVRPNEPARQVIATFERGQRDFHSVSGLRPKYYDVVAVRHEHHNMADTPRDATIAGRARLPVHSRALLPASVSLVRMTRRPGSRVAPSNGTVGSLMSRCRVIDVPTVLAMRQEGTRPKFPL